MNENSLTQCLSDKAIQQLLSDQLTPAEMQTAESHLGDCSICQKQIESLVSKNIGWIDVQTQLAGMETRLYRSNDRSFAEENLASESTLSNLNLPIQLAPTDDPTKLGRLGRYEICGVIGRGSMGIVFKALDPSLNRFVAIKMLASGYVYADASRRRFEREGQAIASVRDPHVIEIHGVEEFRGVPYIVMCYVPGGSLQQRLDRDGPMNTQKVCRIGMQIAKGLQAAHRQGIIHRDIKPANILLEDGSQVAVVSDFGLARVGDEATMTRTGAIAGTPQFMSPEQAKGQELDARSDLFSLGSVLYSLCTGHSPFQGETLMGVVHNVCEANPRAIRDLNPETDAWLAELIRKLLSKNREDRIQTAEELVEILEGELAFLQSPETLPRPSREWSSNKAPDHWVSRWFTKTKIGSVAVIGFGILAIVLALTLIPRSGDGQRWAIKPTTQELNLIQAKASYELAHETHLSEISLRGDMAQSIECHKKAFELGFDPPQSAYNLARAYAYEGKKDEAFRWLETAIRCGFHDRDALVREDQLARIHKDSRYIKLLNRATALANRFRQADRAYFTAKDYANAESIFRSLLIDCPDDEFCMMMIGAALLEQGKYAEAKPWCEKTRNSVRFANFGSYNLGCIATQEGDFDLAIAFLDHAVATGFTDVQHLKADHHLQPLRNQSAFSVLVEKMSQ